VSQEEPAVTTVRKRVILAINRLLTVQASDGYFLYKYHLIKGLVKAGPGNLVRQAGCAYVLGRAAEMTGNPEQRNRLCKSASMTVDALLDRAVVDAGNFFIADLPKQGLPVRGKLGTLALMLAALQSKSLATFYSAEKSRLIHEILSWQRPDGSFRCRTDSVSVTDDASSQDYYPGEALLALAIEVQSGSEECHRAMIAALPWYRLRFRRNPTTAFASWQIMAWTAYASWSARMQVPTSSYSAAPTEFVYEMTDWLLQFQIRQSASEPDLIGGYSQDGRRPGISTASYTEAMICAASLARRLVDKERARRYRDASTMGLQFIYRLQVMPNTFYAGSDPLFAIGGTVSSLSDMTIRCDNDQHAISAYLTALQHSNSLFF